MSHTPGPWRFEVDRDDVSMSEHEGGVRHLYDAEGRALMGGTKYYPWTPDNIADWQLIAAAPDLLAALKAIETSCPCDSDINDNFQAAWGQLRAAIAKAEGR